MSINGIAVQSNDNLKYDICFLLDQMHIDPKYKESALVSLTTNEDVFSGDPEYYYVQCTGVSLSARVTDSTGIANLICQVEEIVRSRKFFLIATGKNTIYTNHEDVDDYITRTSVSLGYQWEHVDEARIEDIIRNVFPVLQPPKSNTIFSAMKEY
jgi:hypothetical protein